MRKERKKGRKERRKGCVRNGIHNESRLSRKKPHKEIMTRGRTIFKQYFGE